MIEILSTLSSAVAPAVATAETAIPSPELTNIGNPLLWTIFFGLVIVVLLIDLVFVGGGKQHRVSLKEAASWSLVWISLAMAFAGGLWWYLDNHFSREIANTKTLEYITGYLIEKSLAVDNVFVWLMLFNFFAIPLELQKRVLTYGVLGAIILRTIMIFAGVWLIEQFHWVLYIFGAFLLLTGLKMWWMADKEVHLENNIVIKWIRNHYPVTTELKGERFFVIENGVKMMTPLFLALIMVEISDVIFAVDSIPAIFAVTSDPFIVLTSNIFAILGLRAMYFLLADMADRFTYIKYGLALVLVFIGIKMLLLDIYKIPVDISLAVVATLIGSSVLISLAKTKRHELR